LGLLVYIDKFLFWSDSSVGRAED
ncbi:MAG: hypothetical protein CFH01_02011, partial [Alphaproteobacteria bacterium MarineAlpha2_Bin1]